MKLIDEKNAGSLALRDVMEKYNNFPASARSSFELSKSAPYYGYVEVRVANMKPFLMFSSNDDFVAKEFFWFGADAYEPTSLKLWLALAKNSAVIFDVGSYTGLYSLAAANLNPKSKVHSFEVLDVIYSRLLVNRNTNSFANMTPHYLGISDSRGILDLNVYAGDSVLSTGSSLAEKSTGRKIFTTKKVNTTSLDLFVQEAGLSRLDLMKIDAEGVEDLIFKGGIQTIQKFKPSIICEFLGNANTSDIMDILRPIGYRFYSISEKTGKVEEVEKIEIATSMDNLNTLLTPKDPKEISALLS